MHPPNIRYIKPYQYRVQPNDDVGTITGFFGMPSHRWPELVGANPQKQLGEVPQGCRHRCFAGLGLGEPLNIPALWREPIERRLGLGAVGDGIVVGNMGAPVDMLAQFQSIFAEVVSNQFPLPPTLTGTSEKVSAVLYSWWQHLGNTLPIPVPPIPTTSDVLVKVITAMGIDIWTKLVISAADFLKAAKVTKADGPSIQNIPWSDFPWQQFPWGAIATKLNKVEWAAITGTMARLGTGGHTTSAIPMSASQSTAPNFITDWAAQPYIGLVGSTKWNDLLFEVSQNPTARACMAAKPETMLRLQRCPECWDTGTTKFIELLCSDKANPCDCKAGTVVPGTTPGPASGDNGGSSNTGWYVAAGVGAIATIAFLTMGKK